MHTNTHLFEVNFFIVRFFFAVVVVRLHNFPFYILTFISIIISVDADVLSHFLEHTANDMRTKKKCSREICE